MSKFVKNVLLFFALIVTIDFACGIGFKYLRIHAKSGDTQKNYYISKFCNEDVLILGSSRAARHYDPHIIEENLGMTCFNCGEPGCGIITAYARYKLVKNRHTPKIVLYEVSPRFDYYISDDYSKYLGRVRQYANEKPVKTMCIELGDKLERFRLMSNLYMNNSFLVPNVQDCFHQECLNGGFEPLVGVMTKESKINISVEGTLIDYKKFSYMENLIKELQGEGVKLFFLASPQYVNYETATKLTLDYKPIIDLCYQQNVPFINHLYTEGISNNREYFHDIKHLNEYGAAAYTKVVCEELIEKFHVLDKTSTN